MSAPDGQIIVVDDNPSVRLGLDSLFRSIGYRVVAHESAEAFSAAPLPDGPACIVLDVRMPGQSGLSLFSRLAQDPNAPPVVFLSGHGDVPMAASAFKAGAVDFLLKPFREQELLDAVAVALQRDRDRRARRDAMAELERRAATLTPRERQVVARVTAAKTNREIALELGLSEIMVKVHRGSMMRKLHAQNLADLTRMLDALRALGWEP